MTCNRLFLYAALWLIALSCLTRAGTAQTRSPQLLVLEKEDKWLAIVNPETLKIVTRLSAGEDPHEVVVTEDGERAYISNYGGFRVPQRTLSVVDLVAHKTMSPVDLGPLRAPHGLDVVNGKVYFTAEGSKAIGSYDPKSQRIEWVLGTGQGRTHMLKVKPDLSAIFTANMTSDSISIFEPDKNSDSSGWGATVIPVGKAPEGFDVSPDGKELWAASHHKAPFLSVVFVNRSYSTGTRTVRNSYPQGMVAEQGEYEGGVFDPPPDFAKN